jgi:isopenicillin N synthase-like dioxygenase
MLAWQEEMIRLGRHLMSCLALSVDLDPAWFDDGLAEP